MMVHETFREELESVTVGGVKIDARGYLTSYQEFTELWPSGPGIIPGRWSHELYLRVDNEYKPLFHPNLDSLIVEITNGQQYKLNGLYAVGTSYWQVPMFCEMNYQYVSREKL